MRCKVTLPVSAFVTGIVARVPASVGRAKFILEFTVAFGITRSTERTAAAAAVVVAAVADKNRVPGDSAVNIINIAFLSMFYIE